MSSTRYSILKATYVFASEEHSFIIQSGDACMSADFAAPVNVDLQDSSTQSVEAGPRWAADDASILIICTRPLPRRAEADARCLLTASNALGYNGLHSDNPSVTLYNHYPQTWAQAWVAVPHTSIWWISTGQLLSKLQFLPDVEFSNQSLQPSPGLDKELVIGSLDRLSVPELKIPKVKDRDLVLPNNGSGP
ncbi:hypothetical protein F53441_10277 [Fusarium austroafricanum]|uniref:Uncharacterized protein n=1 Tax=Fusarium austroafricanum TaxID=2364996 RepID=A0A8H4KB40_9HYPO|nr:hypothetical protein F53441_10277 [Fusarium austroafricanum]